MANSISESAYNWTERAHNNQSVERFLHSLSWEIKTLIFMQEYYGNK